MRRARSPENEPRKAAKTENKPSPSHKSLLEAASECNPSFDFKSTKNSKVWANNYGAVARVAKMEYRQYLNRDSPSKTI